MIEVKLWGRSVVLVVPVEGERYGLAMHPNVAEELGKELLKQVKLARKARATGRRIEMTVWDDVIEEKGEEK